MDRLVQPALLLGDIAVDLFGVVAPPVHAENRSGRPKALLVYCFALVH